MKLWVPSKIKRKGEKIGWVRIDVCEHCNEQMDLGECGNCEEHCMCDESMF